VDWIHLAQDRDWWRDLVKHGNKHSGCIKGRKFLDKLSVLLASQEGLCSMELFIIATFQFRLSFPHKGFSNPAQTGNRIPT
jgi:hypothetical protein